LMSTNLTRDKKWTPERKRWIQPHPPKQPR